MLKLTSLGYFVAVVVMDSDQKHLEERFNILFPSSIILGIKPWSPVQAGVVLGGTWLKAKSLEEKAGVECRGSWDT